MSENDEIINLYRELRSIYLKCKTADDWKKHEPDMDNVWERIEAANRRIARDSALPVESVKRGGVGWK